MPTQDAISTNCVRCKSDRKQCAGYIASLLALLHPINSYSCYYVLPYHVLETPHLGWGVADLSVLFSALSVGEVVGSQIVTVASYFSSDTALFVGHAIQIVSALLGHFLMSPVWVFDLRLFAVGMFILGFSYGTNSVQTYSALIADGDVVLEVKLQSNVGAMYLLSTLFGAFVISTIYTAFGYTAYNVLSMVLSVLMLSAFIALMISMESHRPRAGTAEIPVPRTKEQAEGTEMSSVAMLSPSMWVLLVVKFAQSTSMQIYLLATSVVFSQHFGISAQFGGNLWGTGTVIACVVMWCTPKRFTYPFDVALCLFAIGTTCFLFVVLCRRWIAYSFHILAVASILVLWGIEMKHRVFLCPTEAFQPITGAAGTIQASSLLLWSFLTPRLLAIGLKLPFIVLGSLTVAVAVAALMVYVVRDRFLDTLLGAEQQKLGYLLKERAFYGTFNREPTRTEKTVKVDAE